jgi:hypothetical protein
MVACRIAAVLSQVTVDPTVTPSLNNGGWVYNMAVLVAVIGVIIALALVFGYMRYAPRFQTDESERRTVRAPRMQPGRDVRRPVNVTSAPVVVQPPAVVGAAVTAPGSGSAPRAPAAAAPAAAGASHSPSAATPAPSATAPAPASAQPQPPAATQSATAPSPTAAPATAPPSEEAVAEAASETPSSPAPAAPAAAATAERPEVSLDEETFEKTLAELLAKGTDRRVAEGQARRAAMLAARKKAGG